MADNIYGEAEIVGSSPASIVGAARGTPCHATVDPKDVAWFDVFETRGHVERGGIRFGPVTVTVGLLPRDAGS